ncbi:AAA domain-containing protein [Cytophagales bacterium LB-30]|uniref:AAA domain-containing protein n=1 Tax=Shiella aurantiaca TaxID=3058365 RepID=A0ABT8F7F2_9BACT|nr:AAA domain-containing protein [Shiella aurantiaca]MDN4166407.1 AAA domain-containing protein [Shiella aurantiaca]
MSTFFKAFQKRLTNLSASNRSLQLLKAGNAWFVDLHAFDFANDKPSFSIIESLIAQKKQAVCPVVDDTSASGNTLSKQLRALQRSVRFIKDERGTDDLYVAWPFIRGQMQDGTVVRAPFCFFPVHLEIQGNTWQLSLREGESGFINPSFLLAYSFFNHTTLKPEVLEASLEDYPSDSTTFRTQLYQWLKNSGISLHFNQDIFLDELRSFQTFTKQELEASEKAGMLKLYPEAVLGIFPQAGSYLYPDYEHLVENYPQQSIEDFFSSKNPFSTTEEGTNSLSYLRKVEEEYTYTPFALDATQENALLAVKSGKSLVVQGPPGTGKTQLIGNLIADFAARGKRVLVVSQKRAALDVLYDRMKQAGLDAFMALVHDFSDDRRGLYQKIEKQIQRLEEYQYLNNGLDTIQLERKFIQTSRRIAQLVQHFQEYKNALFDTTEAGISIKELYLQLIPEKAELALKHVYAHFPISEIQDFKRVIKRYFLLKESIKPAQATWGDRHSFHTHESDGLQQIKVAIQEVGSVFPDFKKQMGAEISWSLVNQWGKQLTLFQEGIAKVNQQSFALMAHWAKLPLGSRPTTLGLDVLKSRLMQCYEEEGLELSTSTEEIGRLQIALQDVLANTKSYLHYTAWKLFSKNRIFVKRALLANSLGASKADIKHLMRMVDNRLNAEHLLSGLKEKQWVLGLPSLQERKQVEAWFDLQAEALQALEVFESLPKSQFYLDKWALSFSDWRQWMADWASKVQTFRARSAEWSRWLSEAQIEGILQDGQEAYVQTLEPYYDDMVALDSLWEDLPDFAQEVLSQLEEYQGKVSKEACFEQSIYLAWIQHIENKYPILRSVSSSVFALEEQELGELIEEKSKMSLDILMMRLRERTYQSVEHNRLKNRVTYKELSHQATKKRKIWPIRKLVDTFDHEVFDLLPCWLASPETVSAIFPLRDMFDLVIFDEASQCYAEKGIPAIVRGKQVVIAGDSKQLPPTDLYQLRWEEDTEEVHLEVDSLLDLASFHWDSFSLQSHYRSAHPELIAFSNTYFYQDSLRCLPERSAVNQPHSALHYHKVEGIWEKNANAEEAHYVVQLAKRLHAQFPQYSMGIVTFNQAQRDAIEDLLEAEAWRPAHPSEPLFVKNIENVQGDERDIILFSIAYAPDKKGKFSMQFGSLNGSGGENRLNVAISRARQQGHVVASIVPHELRVDDSKHAGPKLLREYLRFVYEQTAQRAFVVQGIKENSQSLYAKIKEIVPQLVPNMEASAWLPIADLTLMRENEYLGALLSDDEYYYQSGNIKETHAYLPHTLQQKGWPLAKFHSRWLALQRPYFIEQIQKYLTQLNT